MTTPKKVEGTARSMTRKALTERAMKDYAEYLANRTVAQLTDMEASEVFVMYDEMDDRPEREPVNGR